MVFACAADITFNKMATVESHHGQKSKYAATAAKQLAAIGTPFSPLTPARVPAGSPASPQLL